MISEKTLRQVEALAEYDREVAREAREKEATAARLLEVVAQARTLHNTNVVSHTGGRYGWNCRCWTGRRYDKAFRTREEAAQEAFEHENQAIIDALMEAVE